jgi:signal transduction histidine kinase
VSAEPESEAVPWHFSVLKTLRPVGVSLLIAFLGATALYARNWLSYYESKGLILESQQESVARTVALMFADTGDLATDRQRFVSQLDRVLSAERGRHHVTLPDGWPSGLQQVYELGRLEPDRTYVRSDIDLGVHETALAGVVLHLEAENRSPFGTAYGRGLTWSAAELSRIGIAEWIDRRKYQRSLPFYIPLIIVWVVAWVILRLWLRSHAEQQKRRAQEQARQRAERDRERAERENERRLNQRKRAFVDAMVSRITEANAEGRQYVQTVEFDPLIALSSAAHDARNAASGQTQTVASEQSLEDVARQAFKSAWQQFLPILDRLQQQLSTTAHAPVAEITDCLKTEATLRALTKHGVLYVAQLDEAATGTISIPAPWFETVTQNVLDNSIAALDRRARKSRRDGDDWTGLLCLYLRQPTPGVLQLSILDNGGGLEAERISRIYQEPIDSTKGNRLRTGEGTMLVGATVEMFGGKIIAENVDYDGGMLHTLIEFPVSVDAEAESDGA